MDDLEIRYILTIAEEGSLSRAAEKLYVSQPALSKFLKVHERQIGGALFERTRNGLVPTRLGGIYISYASRIQQLMNECEEKIHRSMREEKHELVIGIPSSRTQMCATMLIELMKNNPGYEFRVYTNHSGVISAMLEEGKLDLAVINSLTGGRLLKKEKIGFAIPAVKEQKLGLKPEQAVSLHQIKDESFVVSDASNVIGKAAEVLFRRDGIRPSSLMILDNTQLAWNVARESGRITFCVSDLVPYGFAFHPFDPPLRNEVRLLGDESLLASLDLKNVKLIPVPRT